METLPVLIIQSSETGFDICRESLRGYGFIEGKQFLVFRDEADVRRYVLSGNCQLLITGALNHNDESATRKFVREMKTKNPLLVAASFSAVDMRGEPFDICISKESNMREKLIENVQTFLACL